MRVMDRAVAQQCHANTAVNPFLYTVLLIVTDGELQRAPSVCGA